MEGGLAMEAILERSVALIPAGWQYPEVTEVQLTVGACRYATSGYRETEWRLSHELMVEGRAVGRLEVCYLEKRPAADHGPFLDEELSLLRAVAEGLQRVVTRGNADARYRRLSENSAAVFYQFKMTPQGSFEFLFISDAVATLVGVSADEAMRDSSKFLGRVHPEDQETFRADVLASAQSLEPHHGVFRALKDGQVLWVEAQSTPSPLADGSVVWDGFFLDITERKEAERLLSRERDQAQKVLHVAGVGFVFLDSSGAVRLVNRKACEILECDEHEVLGENWFSTFLPQRLRGPVSAVFEQLMAGTVAPVEYHENAIVTKTGRERTISFHNTVTKDLDGEIDGVLFSAEDITERLRVQKESARLEEQLHQAQKMEAIGRLAGGVAHDFNNVLCAIIGNASLALEDLADQDFARQSIKEITQAAERATDLTRQLLAFSRKQLISPKVLDLSQVIENLHSMLVRLIGENIVLKTLPQARLGRVLVDPAQIDQVVLNLAINARDAMPAGGALLIETADVVLDEGYCRGHASAISGAHVMLAVSDTGCGMSAEVRERVFEPFFTTKQLGQGTGLGLSTVFGIVDQNGGRIEVYSELGRGSSFKVYFPSVLDPAETFAPSKEHAPVGGTETVLVVEDDASVLAVAAKLLERLGYTVLSASSGSDAIALAERFDGPIDLLFTDVVMPHINGRQLSERILEVRPGIKVLYASGYTQNVIAHHGVLDEGVQFIAKPYSPERLAVRVREMFEPA